MRLLKTIFSVPVVIATLAISMPAVSADKAPGSGPNPFSDCGIGAALFSSPDFKWAAVTSNVIWDIGTTAVTSATMSPETCSGKKVVAAKFISDTYNNLAEETATGHGEHLTTVLNIFECDNSRHANAVQLIRDGMKSSVSNPGYMDQSHIDKASNMYLIIEGAVRNTCSA